MENKFILTGNASFENRGCEAITRGTIKILDEIFGIESEYIHESPFYTEDIFNWQLKREKDTRIKHVQYNLKAIDSNNPMKHKIDYWIMKYGFYNFISNLEQKKKCHTNIINDLQEAKAVLCVGGDNYSMDYGYPVKFTNLDDLVLHYKKPCIIWGASVGPFYQNKNYEKFMASHLKKLTGIFAREDVTVEYLDSIGVKENVYRVSDPAFLMQPEMPSDFQELQNLTGSIGINLSPLMSKFWANGNMVEWLATCTEMIDKIAKTFDNNAIYLLPHVTDTNPRHLSFGNNDYRFLKEIYNNLKNKNNNIYLLDNDYTAQETKFLISQMSCLVAARTHATIAGFSTHVPTISLVYSIKALGINKEVYGSHDYCILKENTSIECIIDKIQSVLVDGESIKQTLENNIIAIKQNSFNSGNILKKLIS